MVKSSLFFPSHDIALANGVKHFNPPAAALRLQEDLASLADIWNEPYKCGEWTMPLPWGWDWDTRKHLHEVYGMKMTQLPTDSELEEIRQLSSRQTTVLLTQRLESILPGVVQYFPSYLQSENDLFDFIRQQDSLGNRFVLKSPWSSSGRGLFCSHSRNRDGNMSPVSRQLLLQNGLSTQRKMGGVMGEQWIERKERDFAMLFFASDHDVHFVGYSLFDNDDSASGTTYRQGFLLSNEQIEIAITHGDISLIERLRAIAKAYEILLCDILSPFFGNSWQLGYLGIDMLTYRNDSIDKDTLQIHPCVELNLRCTMGVVCRLWYDKNQQEGIFRISPMQHDGHFNAEFLTTQ